MKRIKCTAKAGDFLFYAIGCVIFSGLSFYAFDFVFIKFILALENINDKPILYFFSVLLTLLLLSPLLAVKPFIKIYNKIKGTERFIELTKDYISFPKSLSSLEFEKIKISTITNVYFSQDRHDNDENLIIKYNVDCHAYIDVNLVSDFELRQIYNKLRITVLL
ncbi:hypothetical protein [Colwellia sp. Arc7-D]|uniref:hypothetical protein n=1 Tax=Colwellia sp. Arc7-D TaxID=2161872 RepID=UPI000D3CCA5D|nr:hypothetical protein [Colwellia sp. Arc7-D]AWB57587.1 hypothetical protein DBO93_08450 [Colwellia sp. Arc7-D]AWB57977.1 hypothetical protein DBO93_10595 [Colwellia sp. Arc7-D]